jgi:hypothetical protein
MGTSGKLVASREEWRSITVCSMLCNEADIQHRFILGNATFNKYKKAWTNKKRLMLYEALVVSVLMCNFSCWTAPKAAQDKLDVVHRRHLRTILNYNIFRTLYVRIVRSPEC